MKILKCLLMIVTAPVILVLTLFVWLCMGLIYISGLVLGLLSTVIALLGVAVLITYSPQNGAILLIMAFLISPMGLPLAAIWLLGKVQSLKFAGIVISNCPDSKSGLICFKVKFLKSLKPQNTASSFLDFGVVQKAKICLDTVDSSITWWVTWWITWWASPSKL